MRINEVVETDVRPSISVKVWMSKDESWVGGTKQSLKRLSSGSYIESSRRNESSSGNGLVELELFG